MEVKLIHFLIFLLHIDVVQTIQKHLSCLPRAYQISDNESNLIGYLMLQCSQISVDLFLYLL